MEVRLGLCYFFLVPENCAASLAVFIVDRYVFCSTTGLPVRPSHKFGFRSSVSKNGHPGEGRHEGLVPRNDVLTNGFI